MKQSYEGKVSAQKDEGGAQIDVLNKQLEVCNKKYETTQKLYEDNTAQIKQIENDMKMAEEAAGQALLASVDKLSEENKKLQAQISEMTVGTKKAPKPSTPVMSFGDLPVNFPVSTTKAPLLARKLSPLLIDISVKDEIGRL